MQITIISQGVRVRRTCVQISVIILEKRRSASASGAKLLQLNFVRRVVDA